MTDRNDTDAEAQNDSQSDVKPSTGGEQTAAQAVEFDALGAAAELDAILSSGESEVRVDKHGESYDEILESEIVELNAIIEKKDADLQAAQEELEKSKERVEREAQRRLEQRTRKMLLGFIDVLDNLDRALASARQVDHNPAVIDGVELVHKSFVAKLASFGVTHKPSLGEAFDPNLHNAVSVMSTADQGQDGKVVAVVQEGYLMGEEILRPAGVVVGKKSA